MTDCSRGECYQFWFHGGCRKNHQCGGVIQGGREKLFPEAVKNIIRKRVCYEEGIDESPSSEEYFPSKADHVTCNNKMFAKEMERANELKETKINLEENKPKWK
jgi:hypothetical protein